MTGDASEEAAWRDLVAQYAAPALTDGTPAPWPTREDLPGPGGAGHDPAAGGPDTTGPQIAGLDLTGPDGTGGLPASGVIPGPPHIRIVRPAGPAEPPGGEDDGDHFVPPEPPPLPRLDPVTKGAWAALFGGPAYLLVAVMAGWQVPDWAAFCAVAAFIGGFAALVVRMGDRPPSGSGPDDGAVV
jgi:hypothetical protein